jgi:hypothetical protein
VLTLHVFESSWEFSPRVHSQSIDSGDENRDDRIEDDEEADHREELTPELDFVLVLLDLGKGAWLHWCVLGWHTNRGVVRDCDVLWLWCGY